MARELALKLGARAHKVLDVTLNELAVSSLTRDGIPVPDYEPEADGIPNTFVPGRDLVPDAGGNICVSGKSRSRNYRRL